QARLVLAHMSQQSTAIAVPDGVEPVTRETHGAQLVVHVDKTPFLAFETDRFEPYVDCLRPSPYRNDQLVTSRLAPIVEGSDDRSIGPLSARRGHVHSCDDGDPLGFERPPHVFTGEWFLACEQAVRTFDHRHIATGEPAECLRHLDADRAAA